MNLKEKVIVICIIIIFLFTGLAIFRYGVLYGDQVAIQLTRPAGAVGWTTSEMQMKLVSYGICIFGGLWVLISHVLFVLYIAQNFIFNTGRHS